MNTFNSDNDNVIEIKTHHRQIMAMSNHGNHYNHDSNTNSGKLYILYCHYF